MNDFDYGFGLGLVCGALTFLPGAAYYIHGKLHELQQQIDHNLYMLDLKEAELKHIRLKHTSFILKYITLHSKKLRAEKHIAKIRAKLKNFDKEFQPCKQQLFAALTKIHEGCGEAVLPIGMIGDCIQAVSRYNPGKDIDGDSKEVSV